MQKKLLAEHIYGSSLRLFLNTELGCASACSYCYLPVEGFPINASRTGASRRTANQILAELDQDERVIRGPQGTIFSIGCFSECWDKRNRKETLALILGLLPFGNPIQIATKRRISKHDLSDVIASPYWQKQLYVYISSSSVSDWQTFERGTGTPKRRFESFEACRDFGIHVFLYIKPVIPNVTINDIAIYGAIMEQYRLTAIVGDQFEKGIDGLKSPISDSLIVATHSEVNKLREALAVYGRVYANSTDTIRENEFREPNNGL